MNGAISNKVYDKMPTMNFTMIIKAPAMFVKLNPQAKEPVQDKPTNVGYDLTLIGRTENRVDDTYGDVNYFNTGLSVVPPDGYYFELLGRENLLRAGYILQGPIIIDPEDRNEVLVPLYKYKEVDDCELPILGARLVLRQAEYFHLTQAQTKKSTKREVVEDEEDRPLNVKPKKGTTQKKQSLF